MTSNEIRQKFLKFFEARGHVIIPSASLVPNEEVGAVTSSQTLFTTAGMQPLIPYLLGKPHPAGVARLANVQKCVRTGDIDDVGDNRHLTFFEMLGNWSLGDYFKCEAIEWSFTFLTSKEKGLGLDPSRLYVTVFKGENGIPRDEESIKIWQEVLERNGLSHTVAGDDEIVKKGIRIVPLGVADNFWIAGDTGPCGGDTEMFYDTRPEAGALEGKFSDFVDSFRLIEVWNDVFMEFNKTAVGHYEPLAAKNVDTGMGLERTTAVVNGFSTVFDTDCFTSIFEELRRHFTEPGAAENLKAQRIVADHMRTAVFMLADGVTPSNTDRGYVLRRILRRAFRYADALSNKSNVPFDLAAIIIKKYQDVYAELAVNATLILEELKIEQEKFNGSLHMGFKELRKMNLGSVSGKELFDLYQTFSFPLEFSLEEIEKETSNAVSAERKKTISQEFNQQLKKHQELSRAGADKKFKGGLGDTSDMSIKYHTTTHLLNAALRHVLGPHVGQRGSNITPERLRFDFTHSEKMTDDQKKKVEELVNGWIKENLPVTYEELPKIAAEKIAIHAFNEKYGETVKVYSIGTMDNYISREFCGGPHVTATGDLGHFKISKEEAVSAGVRRIRATLT